MVLVVLLVDECLGNGHPAYNISGESLYIAALIACMKG